MVLMGGAYTPEVSRVEWNVGGDPLAAQMVFNAPLPVLRAVGLNVTQKLRLTADEVRRRFTAPLLKPVLDFAEIWFAEFSPHITFHDPLAAAVIFDERLCTFQPGTITVKLQDTPGKTLWQTGDSTAPHQAAFEVDAGRFFEHFFRVF
jgi:inosine-uridine nucleoside N-ribohydrolase